MVSGFQWVRGHREDEFFIRKVHSEAERVERMRKIDSEPGWSLRDRLLILPCPSCRVHNRHKAARESEYPAYGVTGPAKERSGGNSPVAIMDAKLASSAQLYHYQHTKQQIIAMEQ